MPNLNVVHLIGNVTRDVELKFLQSNTAVADIGLAINHTWKDSSGEKKKEVCFVDVTAFGKTAEILNQYVKKGDHLYLQGRLKLDQWEDKDGNKRQKLKVIADSFQFLKGKGGDEAPATQQQSRQPQRQAPKQQVQEPMDEDNVPF